MSAATEPLIVYSFGDGAAVVLRGSPCPDFECWPGTDLEEFGIAPAGGGLWVWADAGSSLDNEGYERWLGEWRRPSPDELTALAEDRGTP